MKSSSPQAPVFVIWAPSYNENIGGVIALHTLCSRLNALGWTAKLWPPYADTKLTENILRLPLRFAGKLDQLLGYDRGPDNNPLARRRDLEGAIFVYPEVVRGNPSGAKHIVRWILYHPDGHTGSFEYNDSDLIVPFSEEFLENSKLHYEGACLRVTRINPSYRQYNQEERSGSCCLVYKGKDRNLNRHPPDSIKIDGLPHSEIAKIFNRTKYLYSYDLYSFYNTYAALCGCIPVIIPKSDVPRDRWYADERLRYGMAYGESDIPWAIATREKLIAEIKKSELEEEKLVQAFAKRSVDRFFGADTG